MSSLQNQVWLERAGLINEGIFSRKPIVNKESGMSDSEALHHLVKHSVQFHTPHHSVTGYSWHSSAGKKHYEEYSSDEKTNHADKIHTNVIPEIQYQENKLKV